MLLFNFNCFLLELLVYLLLPLQQEFRKMVIIRGFYIVIDKLDNYRAIIYEFSKDFCSSFYL